MKKILVLTCVLSFVMGAKTLAADTYTGGLLDSLNQRIDRTAAPVVNRERDLRAQQKAAQDLKQQQMDARQRQIQAQQDAQQALINKKKHQIQNQKDLFNQQKNELKGIFSVQ